MEDYCQHLLPSATASSLTRIHVHIQQCIVLAAWTSSAAFKTLSCRLSTFSRGAWVRIHTEVGVLRGAESSSNARCLLASLRFASTRPACLLRKGLPRCLWRSKKELFSEGKGIFLSMGLHSLLLKLVESNLSAAHWDQSCWGYQFLQYYQVSQPHLLRQFPHTCTSCAL